MNPTPEKKRKSNWFLIAWFAGVVWWLFIRRQRK